jgi:glutamine synthetase
MKASAGINEQVRKLQTDFGFIPVVACEIEFVLHDSQDEMRLAAFWRDVKNAAPPLFKIEKERGHLQHEVALMPAFAEKAAEDAIRAKQVIADAANAQGMRADFGAKPFPGQPGNGLHVHIHLQDAQGVNVYTKDDDHISGALKFSIGGLLAKLKESMPVFAPNKESGARFVAGSNAPLTVSWGANNRTVAIRLPDTMANNKRIEHRVPGSDADPEQVIKVILEAIHYGLTNQTVPGPQIYGDASLQIYDLPKILVE